MKLWISIAAFSLMECFSLASLQWEQELIRLKVHPLQEVIGAEFRYTNTGQKPVEIIKIDSSCGCLVPTSGKQTVPPGASGGIEVEFLLRGRSGKQKKQVLVTTDNNINVPYHLDLAVDIPESYLPSVKRVVWERADTYKPQTVRLINHFNQPIELVEALPTIGTLKVELIPVKPGFEYDLIITPNAGVENLRAFIRVKPKAPPGLKSAKDFKVYVFVK